MIIFIFAAGVFAAGALLAGCAGRAAAPAGGGHALPRPDAPFTPAPSILYIPVEIKTAYLEKTINDQLGGTLYKSDTLTLGGFSNVTVSVKKQGRVKINVRDGELAYNMPLKISMKFSFTIGALGLSHTEYQSVDAGISLKLRSKITLKNNWRLVTSTKAEGYIWTSDPVVKLRSVTIPVKPAADMFMARSLETLGGIIDKSVSGSLDAKTLIDPLWQQLRTPIEIAAPEIQDKIWLRITPSEVYASRLYGSGGSIKATVGIRAVTEAFMGNKPEALTPAPIPDFSAPPETDSSFTINLYSEVPYADATRMAKEQFVGKTFKSGRQKVTVNDIEIAGADGLAALTMDLSGSIKGKVCVIGRAAYNEKTQTVSLENLDFDVMTNNNFEKAKNWLLKGIIIAKMKPMIKYPLGELIAEAKILADKMLTDYELYEGIILNGRVDELGIGGVEMTDTALRVGVVAKGTLGVGVR